jgi:integrase
MWKDLRKKRYFVRFGTSRTTESFALEKSRNARAQELFHEAEKHGTSSLDYSTDEVREWVAFKKKTGATLESVEELWKRYSPALLSTISTRTAVKDYLKLRLNEDIAEKTDTYSQMVKHLEHCLVGIFGDRQLSSITTIELREIMAQLKDRAGNVGKASKVTRRNYRKNWNVFFNRAVAEKWISENPCKGVKPPPPEDEEGPLMPIKDAFHFLKVNLNEPVLPRIALEMWGFFRSSAAARVKKENINFEDKVLYMKKHKSKKRKFREGHSPVLWEWLARATDETWELSERMYDLRKGQAFVRAGLKNPGNVFRHSCISYGLAATTSFDTTGYLAQHTDKSTTEGYQAPTTKREARLWYKLTPEAVAGTWEDFQKLNQQPEGTE